LIAPRQLDARKCISYLTIETPKVAPEPLRSQIGEWFFGCDICQTVCPWNIKALGRDELARLDPPDDNGKTLESDLRYILTSSNRRLEKVFRTTPLARINGLGLKRNALVVIGNRKLKNLRPEVEASIPHPRLMEVAQWAIAKMDAD
jgi:epoxyqueuosine reductase